MQSQTICSISGGRISIKVLAASFLIELFLIGPRGRSAIFHSVIIKQFLMFTESKVICCTSVGHEGKLVDGPDDLLHVVLVVRPCNQLLQRVQLGRVDLDVTTLGSSKLPPESTYLSGPFQLVFTLLNHWSQFTE